MKHLSAIITEVFFKDLLSNFSYLTIVWLNRFRTKKVEDLQKVLQEKSLNVDYFNFYLKLLLSNLVLLEKAYRSKES